MPAKSTIFCPQAEWKERSRTFRKSEPGRDAYIDLRKSGRREFGRAGWHLESARKS